MYKEYPLISIILPIYNGKQYIEETITNILDSDYKNIEVLCIDDCSEDGSGEICKRICAKDSRVIYHRRTENGGVAAARNTGLKLCKGELVCFADQDDIVAKEFYSVMAEDIVSGQCDIAISNIVHLVNGKSVFKNTIKEKKILSVEEKKNLAKWLIMDSAVDVMPESTISKTVWNVIFTKKIIDDNDLQFKRVVAYEDDWLFLIEAILMSDRVILEPRNLYTWRIHSTQTTYNPKYIENYPEKRIKLRKIVDRFLVELQYTTDEIHRYDVCYRMHVMYEALRNEWNCYLKDGSYRVENLERTKRYLEAYLHDTTNWDLFVVAHKNYGILTVIILWLYIKDQYELLFLFMKSIEKIKKIVNKNC